MEKKAVGAGLTTGWEDESELRSGGRHMEALPFLRESHSMLPRRPTIYPGTEMALVQVCVCAVRCKGEGRWTALEVRCIAHCLCRWGGAA
jgi:hypothetical protein